MNALCYVSLLLWAISLTQCSRILGVFPSSGYSQFILCEKLMAELARRGHEVTVISAYKPKEDITNYKTILTDGLVKETEENMFLLEDITALNSIVFFYKFGLFLTEYILSHQEVQGVIHSNETFDLVIVEQFGNEAHMGFSRHFGAHLILFSSIGLTEWNSHLVGNTRLLSNEPILFTPYTNRMSFFQRLHNTIINILDTLYKHLFVFPQQQELLTKYFPNKIHLDEIIYNASLLLLNSHPSTNHPSFLTSSIVEIGGFHITSKSLPGDIQKSLDEAKDGAILFSMGSNLKMSHLPNHTLNAILNVFSKLKHRVLWKFDGSSIQSKPNNVLISKWLPQSDILAHPNTVAFVTHGGLLSTTEAVFYGVPMVGIPIFGDQKMNVARSVQKGIAVYLPFKGLSEVTLYGAISEILNNPKYKQNSKRYSDILRDRPVKPLDLATYWIEYVIKHGGASHLRNASLDLNWFQLYLLDVVGVLALLVVVLYFFIKLLCVKIYVILKNNTKNKSSKDRATKKRN
ncbi:hypothetical protein NQ318_011392 [Aromia moschata]|uniref:UDP-glucuronosyltransferase n=1 Tax=Aromia moschata TaxID=1265417 RepID=A0AAV8YT94_9CUCU|nr:hypothetical protein NQ318_011392 [Aromia moschata]